MRTLLTPLFLLLLSTLAYTQSQQVGCTTNPNGTTINPCSSAPNSIQVTVTPASISVSATAAITANIVTADGNVNIPVPIISNCTFTSSNAGLATVSGTTLTGVSSGTVTISASCVSGSSTLLGVSGPVTINPIPQIVNPLIPCSPSPCALNNATNGTPYSFQLAGASGVTPYTWSVTSGALPTGLSLSTSGCAATVTQGNCNIQGTPSGYSSPTIVNFTITLTDSGSNTTNAAMSITVNPASGGCTTATRGGSANPPNYGNVRVDACVSAITNIPAVWTNYTADYGFLGAGTVFTGTMGLKQARLTDGCTDTGSGCTTGPVGVSFINNYSGGDTDQHWASDSSMFTFGENAGGSSFFALLTKSSGTIGSVAPIRTSAGGPLFSIPSKTVAFDQDVPGLVYMMCFGCTGTGITSNNAAIYSYNLNACTLTSCAPTPTLIYDFGGTGNCLSGISPTHNSLFFVSHSYTVALNIFRVFSIPLSYSGGQNTDTLMAALNFNTISPGHYSCYVWNTSNVAAPYGPNSGTTGIPAGNSCTWDGTTQTCTQVNMLASGYVPPNATGATASEVGNTVTVVSGLSAPVGYTVTLSGFSVSGYNGAFAVVGESPNGCVATKNCTSFTYTNPTSGLGAATGGTVALTSDLFTIHSSYGHEGHQWVTINASGGVCLWGGCNPATPVANTPAVWAFGTSSVLSTSMGGHVCVGQSNIIHGTNSPQTMMNYIPIPAIGSWATFTKPTGSSGEGGYSLVGSIPAPGSKTLDSHCTWANANSTDTLPILDATSNETGNAGNLPDVENNGCLIPNPLWTSAPSCGSTNNFTGPYVNEILLEPTSASPSFNVTCAGNPCNDHLGGASGTPYWRVGNHLSSVTSQIFNAANGTIAFSPDGLFYTFTSDWLCTLGTNVHTTISGGSPVGNPPVCGGLPWIKSHVYSAGAIITPGSANTPNCTFKTTAGGTSGATAPTWVSGSSCLLTPITDNSVTWNVINSAGTLPGQQNMRSDVFVGATQ